ncbi:MAG: ABC transporter substrate-binding protein [Actinomycetota bacterium]
MTDSRPTHRPATPGAGHRRSLVVLGAVVLALGATACGQGSAPAATPKAAPSVDQGLRAALPAAIRARGELRVGTDASYPPMSSFGPDGRTVVGIEPDLATEIGRRLGLRITFVDTDFGALLTTVQAGDLDLAMAAITDTPARGEAVDFVNYFVAGTAIVVQRGNPAAISDLKDLCGKVVAVERDTVQVELLTRAQRNCEGRPILVSTYPTNSDALLRLRTGRAAAVLNDLPPAVLLTTDVKTRSQYQLASTTQYEPAPYGIAVAKSQPGLRDAVQGALQQALTSGAYGQALNRWKVRTGAVDQVTVNSGR